ncbi:hypothetical protein E3N88_23647 [Mikania micrantha]|uniref:ARID domain-containing protein n=1 Tax=Mikania micrantha TaxID=192012 RepID=A0A5N6NDV3_9ASTR|nr:hypothetical protein E3N88_23647 [Mikania micrantha]
MRNVKFKPKLDSRKHHCENSGIRARLGKNPYTTYVLNPNSKKHFENQKIEIVQSDSDKTHVRRDVTGRKGKHKLHLETRLSVSQKFEHGFQKDDTAGTSKGKAKCFEQECVPVRTSFDGLDHDEFLEKFYKTLDDQTVFELERKKFEAYLQGYYDKECEKTQEMKNGKTKSWVTLLDILHIPNYVMTSKEYLRAHFTKMVKWFYEEYFQQNTKEYPPTLPNGEPIDLFDLYMTVEGLGGRRVVAKENKWLEVGKELGLVENGPNLRIIYDGYLELLDWMYSIEKEKESRINETPNEEEKDKGDGPSVKKESEEVRISPKNCDEATTSSIQDEEKQHEDGEIPDSELYFQEMLDASFDDDFELELLEYAERNKDDVAEDEDKVQGLGGMLDDDSTYERGCYRGFSRTTYLEQARRMSRAECFRSCRGAGAVVRRLLLYQ